MAERSDKRKRAAKRISLTPAYRAILARKVLEPADKLANRIAEIEPLAVGLLGTESMPEFASRLRLEISVAYNSGGLSDFSLDLPDVDNIYPLLEKTVSKEEGSPGIPGIALILKPGDDSGWTGRFAGESHAKRVKVDPSKIEDESLAFRNKILEGWANK